MKQASEIYSPSDCYWQSDPFEDSKGNDGTVLYQRRCQERRLDIGSIPMPIEYISTESFTNVEYLDTVIDSFANLLHIEEKDEEPTQTEIDKTFVIPTPNRNHRKDKAPIVLMKSRSVNGQLCGRPSLCLLDSGSTGCLFNKRSLPFGTKTNTTTNKILQTTTQGTHTCNEFVSSAIFNFQNLITADT